MSSGRGNRFLSKACPGPDGKPRERSKGLQRHRTITGMVPTKVIVDEAPTSPRRFEHLAIATRLDEITTVKPKALVMDEGTPGDWHILVALDHDGRCAVTGVTSPHWDSPDFECHHIIEKKLLRQRGLGAWVWDRRIGVYVTTTVHAWFDDASDRCIPREVLHPCIWTLCAEIDEHQGTSWATEYVLDRYPIVGPERLAELRSSPTPEHP